MVKYQYVFNSHPTEQPYPSPYGLAKHTDIMHMRHAMTNLVNWKDSLHCLNFIQLKKNSNFRLISGVQHLKKIISGFRFYHQKMRNNISGGLLGGIFEIQDVQCLKPRFQSFLTKNGQAVGRLLKFLKCNFLSSPNISFPSSFVENHQNDTNEQLEDLNFSVKLK